jgi:L-asparaginase/Glu-tRNA(Gln) amidotransferase subunit D
MMERLADRRRTPIIALVVALMASTLAMPGLVSAATAQADKPVIKIVATGGTIANTPSGRLAVEDIIEQLPEVEELAELRVEDVTRG